MKSLISNTEYVLIAIGLVTIPLVIGLFILAVIAWRIGTRMENSQNYVNVQNTYDLKDEKTYKPDEYSIDVLENGK